MQFKAHGYTVEASPALVYSFGGTPAARLLGLGLTAYETTHEKALAKLHRMFSGYVKASLKVRGVGEFEAYLTRNVISWQKETVKT